MDLVIAIGGDGTLLRAVSLALQYDVPVLGINTAIISIIAQNIGAKYYDRVEQSYFTSIKYSRF